MEKIKKCFDLEKQNNLIIPGKKGKIMDLIYEVRGVEVMLDSDLAVLYQCKNGTKEINQAVKNNLEKFPERFSFKLTQSGLESFLVKNFDQKKELRGGKFKNPRFFTEQGVAMLATILKSDVATQVSIAIMDAFVLMRRIISEELMEQKYVNNLVFKHDEEIKLLQESFNNFKSNEKINMIFYEGQIYDAYSKLVDIMNKAKENIILIDNCADKSG